MLIGANGDPAGDFSLYPSKCDLFKAGWKLFRPEAYDFSLVLEGATPSDDTVVDAEDVECPEDAPEDDADADVDDADQRRIRLLHATISRNSEEAKR